ncbi:L-2-hydroxyglutarate oxidase [Pseudomonas savastanoi]|uniref:L-2-hydroxyglutarate oxidase n=1 Tax=Pseudomonas savastanoi TaxID=29438 RepID=UPI00197EE484|nr:L-2-hydroxyglutarate oxidase [Pseudomonas savastanoi]MBN4178785.1 L-2-hydroxyglutarate oxidase LhgO [Pseudomonas savastanoi pv. phaseolicola]
MIYDFCVIGGGIVGLATALQLLEIHPGASLVLIEKETAIAKHQTGHNSGVIHAGVYYDPGSLKATLCKRGAELTKSFCTEHKIPFEVCGKMLVASNTRQYSLLSKLEERARKNGLNVARLDAPELSRREPNITGLGALFVDSTGIVDYRIVSSVMANLIEKKGGKLELEQKIIAIQEHASHVSISSDKTTWSAKKLVVCAGLQSDRLAALAGLNVDFQIIPFRGEYFRLPPEKNNSINHLIYPVPEVGLPFLGIHLTRMIDGGVTVGPNAVLGLSREGYAKLAFNARDVLQYGSYSGFWKLLGKNLSSGLSEIRNTVCKKSYLEQCRRYYPSLTLEDLQPLEAGIRAQAVTKKGNFVQDFLFVQTPRMLHVCNAPSPAATSAIPIAEMIVSKLSGTAI